MKRSCYTCQYCPRLKCANIHFIFNSLNKKCNWIAEYDKVKVAIPKGWKAIFSGEQAVENILDENMQLNSTEVTILHESISINNREEDLGKG